MEDRRSTRADLTDSTDDGREGKVVVSVPVEEGVPGTINVLIAKVKLKVGDALALVDVDDGRAKSCDERSNVTSRTLATEAIRARRRLSELADAITDARIAISAVDVLASIASAVVVADTAVRASD